ncbi:MAG: hypothetical protein WD532_10860 [Acidimicrobiia bacterium]
MRRSKQHFDSQIERLLAGGSAPDLGNEISELVHRLQQQRSGNTPGVALASALAEEARKSESVPTRVSSRASRQLPTRWRRRIMISTFLSSLLGKMAIGAVALASTTGGLAATGNLPDPVQEWSANQLAEIGIEIPNPETDDETSADVLDAVNGGSAEDGDEFGKNVADVASDEKSTEGLERADDGADNADARDEASEVADQFTDGDVDGSEVADESKGEVELPAESSNGAETGDSFRP